MSVNELRRMAVRMDRPLLRQIGSIPLNEIRKASFKQERSIAPAKAGQLLSVIADIRL